MKECVIIHYKVSKLTLLDIFRGSGPPSSPRIYALGLLKSYKNIVRIVAHCAFILVGVMSVARPTVHYLQIPSSGLLQSDFCFEQSQPILHAHDALLVSTTVRLSR